MITKVSYTILVEKKVAKKLKKLNLPKNSFAKWKKAARHDPYSSQANDGIVKELCRKGAPKIYKKRFGNYRMFFAVIKKELKIISFAISHRKESYKNL